MGGEWIIRGVPERLARDGWWFLDEKDDATPPGRTPTRRMSPKALAALALLIVLADGLFWDVDLGISVALYAMVLSACMIALKPGGVTGKEAALAMGVALLCNLPVIEHLQALSVMFSALGVAAILAWVTLGPKTKAGTGLLVLFQATFIGPIALPIDAVSDARGVTSGFNAAALARAAALPLGIGAVFLLLFVSANPILEAAFANAGSVDVLSPATIVRMLFWAVAACLIWPYLTPKGRWQTGTETAARLTFPSTGLINGRSVLLSLMLFNVMFAVQTASDLIVLTGGAALPDGMTYAEYAHQGAYPLLITALLSGLFAIATQRRVAISPLMRRLMYLWLGQNLILVVTAAVRLGLYVEAYSLTYLRLAAFIWMGLIFLGLVLIVIQLHRNLSLKWLLESNAIAMGLTLYICCFVNFAYLITDYNMAHRAPEALDLSYLCRLGEQAIPAMMEYGQINDSVACGRGQFPALQFDPIADWQEWGFRRWRLQRYLETYHDL